ncbi:hypothetical protein CLV84_0009 [Neolewinella xylanilytica]|uniref:NAD glycohydrolase translocation F5/8 type C domain-containing protein n=1 Tax=Neolewinella xylanilytica TaxID=1514080 RepID=A0A2S6I6D7_9BACT|nr:hypothetical protein CLV84_0009 [Neolewinella xylanilytica]
MQSAMIILAVMVLMTIPAISQDTTAIYPDLLHPNDYSKKQQTVWEKSIDNLVSLNTGENNYLDLDSISRIYIDSLEETLGPLTEGAGCSWYCGGGPSFIESSEVLAAVGDLTYDAANVHDFNLFTGWAPVRSMGANINFHFDPRSPRINAVIIYNGYIKNKEIWNANSRARELLLKVNGRPHAILKLLDVTNGQRFEFYPVGSTLSEETLVLSFEVLSIYRGEKYDDLVISEINFDGLDVH